MNGMEMRVERLLMEDFKRYRDRQKAANGKNYTDVYYNALELYKDFRMFLMEFHNET